MADETSAQMEKMNVDEKKEETAAAMGGREGVAPPIDTGCVAHVALPTPQPPHGGGPHGAIWRSAAVILPSRMRLLASRLLPTAS